MFFRSLGAFFSTLAPQDSESTGESLPRPKFKSEFTVYPWKMMGKEDDPASYWVSVTFQGRAA